MGLRNKLFPKKGKEKDKTVINIKKQIHQLQLKSKALNQNAELYRKNAKIALRKGNKERSKNYLVQWKSYMNKVNRNTNLASKLERYIDAIEEGTLIKGLESTLAASTAALKELAVSASPEKVASLSEESEEYIAMIEESGEILAGDPEIDQGIDIDDEFQKLESEVLLEAAGEIPEAPVSEEFVIEEVSEAQTKEKLKDEIDKLKKELEE
jgi:hypothetical protein